MLFVLTWLTSMASTSELADYLADGDFAEGAADFQKRMNKGNESNEDKFSLGVLQFFEALEGLAQDFSRLGLNSRSGQRANLPFLRLPVPINENPELATPESINEALERFHARLSNVNKTLQNLDNKNFSTSIDISTIRIDFDNDQKLEENEYFHQVYTAYNRHSRELFIDGKSLVIDFDLGDAYWLKGYSHLLMALSDTLLAHKWDEVYKHSAHVFFSRVSSDIGTTFQKQGGAQYSIWVDLIAGIHVMNLEVQTPKRLISAHSNLIKVIECSRLSWSHIEKETDDENEWIPNPQQIGVTGVQISQDMLDGWKEFLNEFESILTGSKLVPHWRFKDGRGINIQRVFHDPRSFDLVLWVQGSAAIPYLEEGNLSSKDTWSRITRIFQGNFIGFAIWVN